MGLEEGAFAVTEVGGELALVERAVGPGLTALAVTGTGEPFTIVDDTVGELETMGGWTVLAQLGDEQFAVTEVGIFHWVT